MAVTEQQARARIRAFRLLEILLASASKRLSVAQGDFRREKIKCCEVGMAWAIKDSHEAFMECGEISNRIQKLGIRKRVA